MNEHDRYNIEFIRSIASRPDELTEWFAWVQECGDENEIQYAIEMLFAARNEIEMDLLELHDTDAEYDVTQAADYLRRFQLQ